MPLQRYRSRIKLVGSSRLKSFMQLSLRTHRIIIIELFSEQS